MLDATDSHDVRTVSPAVPQEPIWRLSVEQYHEMIRTGIIGDDDPVELLEGWLVQKMGKNPPHASTSRRLHAMLQQMLPKGFVVISQDPVTLGDSEPEPDVSVARGEMDALDTRHPFAEEIKILVEVADSSLVRDKTLKRRIYARNGIPCYWIVNLVSKKVEVYAEPSGSTKNPGYSKHQDYGLDESVPVSIDGKLIGSIPVRDIIRG